MNVSVLVPAFNAAATIRATLDSVLSQTMQPDEILVMDDGSTDDTATILASYGQKLTVLRQSNSGPSSARNALCLRAHGSLIAFLDSDDIWQREYLEMQWQMYKRYADAAAFFAGHVNFYGTGICEWPVEHHVRPPELIAPLTFFKRYNTHNGLFSSYSFCCIPKRVINELGAEPFCVDGAEDFYCTALLSLRGPVVYLPTPLAGYRVRKGSHSSGRLAGLAARIRAFELLQEPYRRLAPPDFILSFKAVFASHRRLYAKYLLGAKMKERGRRELVRSLSNSTRPISIAKSLLLLALTYLPANIQPQWPTGYKR
jgi:glycosyltransferase involved in cell wall biosynthesis